MHCSHVQDVGDVNIKDLHKNSTSMTCGMKLFDVPKEITYSLVNDIGYV